LPNQIIFTTLLSPENIEWIKLQSARRNCDPSDVLNELIKRANKKEKDKINKIYNWVLNNSYF